MGNVSDIVEDTVRPWLKGFVQSVGVEKARHVLRGVGDLVHPSLKAAQQQQE